MTDGPTCSALLDLIEPIAAGEVDVSEEVRAHLETCPRCASAVASARRIEAALASRDAPPAPPGFTASVVARVRREQWHADQRLDRAFNLVILACAAGLAASVSALLNVEVVLAAASAFWNVAADITTGRNPAPGPSLVTWVGAAAFIGFALGLWWWTEQRFSS